MLELDIIMRSISRGPGEIKIQAVALVIMCIFAMKNHSHPLTRSRQVKLIKNMKYNRGGFCKQNKKSHKMN